MTFFWVTRRRPEYLLLPSGGAGNNPVAARATAEILIKYFMHLFY